MLAASKQPPYTRLASSFIVNDNISFVNFSEFPWKNAQIAGLQK